VIGVTIRFWNLLFSIGFCSLLAGCLPDSSKISPQSLFVELGKSEILPRAVEPNKFPALNQAAPGYVPLGIYKIDDFSWALFDMPDDYVFTTKLNVVSNRNLHIVAEKPIPPLLKQSFNNLIPELGYEQLGIFAYPLALCFFLSIFITLERLYSLRRGLTFPRKVEKALLNGEFPDKKWKQGSAAERIVHVAIQEKASEETLRAYAKLEVSSMERGMFLLEVVVAGAPLIGLLGTVTGLIEVFSQMPTGGMVDKSLFSQGISLALLTTMVGLAIALPTLLFNSYLQRILDKRASALEWLTARLIEATDRKGSPPEVIR
jgi:biopolymer transport protein ExbB